jgi:predicted transposase YdaD
VIRDTDTVETIIPEEIMKESAFYQHIVNKARAEGFAEGFAKGLLVLIRKRFTSIPRTISAKIKSIHDKDTLLTIQKMAIDAKTKKEFIEAFNALNI